MTGDWDELERWEHNQWHALQKVFDPNTFETIAETTTAYITRAQFREPPVGPIGTVAVVIKSASVDARFSKQPHDIGKELRILLRLAHKNVIGVLGQTYETLTNTLHYWMPFVPFHLADVISNPRFSPYAHPGSTNNAADPTSFLIVAKSIAYQTLSALEYIHARGIAHRDVKPRNLLLNPEGCVVLIDFGVAWSRETDDRDLWPEPRGSMCVDVSTGPYRAPELLFGATDYDACATDLWSLGAVFAEFFTPMRLRKAFDDDDDDDWYADGEDIDSDSDEPLATLPFIVPKGISPTQQDVEWTRDSLFDGDRGQIGLAWSIFKVFGTPTDETWPAFKELPDAQKVTFVQVPPVDSGNLFPNIPPVGVEEHHDFLDIVLKLLIYPPEWRIRASIALEHPLFTGGLPILLPAGYPEPANGIHTTEWDGHGLAELLSRHVSNAS